MKAQFDQNLLSSFYLWLENRLLKSDTKAYLTGLSNNFRYVDFDDMQIDSRLNKNIKPEIKISQTKKYIEIKEARNSKCFFLKK